MRASFFVAALVLSVTSHVAPAHACKCDQGSFEQRYQAADLVFFGVAATYRGSDANSGRMDLDRDYWEFEVQGSWKGPPEDRVRLYLHAPNAGSDCNFSVEFEPQQSYLVYASADPGHPDRYRATVCSGTVPASRARPDLSHLGEPKHRFRK